MTKEEVVHTGVSVVTLPALEILEPAPPATYLGVAYSFLPAIRRLAPFPGDSAIPHAHLCAHALECALKAYLSRAGDDSTVRGHQIRHDLNALWGKAAADGLAIPACPPQWVHELSDLHASPFYLRYAPGVHIISTPPARSMTIDLEGIVELVAQSM